VTLYKLFIYLLTLLVFIYTNDRVLPVVHLDLQPLVVWIHTLTCSRLQVEAWLC